jgi:XTP/dITP diphosphohydrolase
MTELPPSATSPAPGDQVYRLVAVMDRLRAPGGCPWDARQDHRSLVQYLLEEAYEAAEAIETGDRAALREELGDVLLQVVFHAAIARESDQPFDLDAIAADVADKLIRRHPHVFDSVDDDVTHLTAEQSYARWDSIKTVEKNRTSVLDGIPVAQSALARAQKVVGRARRGGIDWATSTAAEQGAAGHHCRTPANSTDIGERLIAIVREADALGVDAEGALRQSTRVIETAIRAAEQTAAPQPGGPATPNQPRPDHQTTPIPGRVGAGADTTRR